MNKAKGKRRINRTSDSAGFNLKEGSNSDELDVKIFRALMSESTVAGSSTQFKSTLRTIASRLGADDTTVTNRYKRLQQSGAMSGWQLMINPNFFACRMGDIMVDVQPESAKADMIRKLRLVDSVIMLMNFYGKAVRIFVTYNTDESYSRTVELVSRIANARDDDQGQNGSSPVRDRATHRNGPGDNSRPLQGSAQVICPRR